MRTLPVLAIALVAAACVQTVAPVVVPSVASLPAPETPRAAPPMPALSTALPDIGSANSDLAALAARSLAFPVAGASMDRVQDSFDEPRDGGRVHRAIDILAPRGTPVLSADDGRILRLSTSTLGGITVYASDASERFVYYYAHLERYRPGLSNGERIAKGDTLGYVGTTGNAPKDTPHLHFQIMRMPDDRKQFWNGEPIDPFPLFKDIDRRQRIVGPRF
jgi:peptidoglycan LD-endopeptidase LytH